MDIKEIERKFLIREKLFELPLTGTQIKQGYLSTNPDRVIRVRIEGNKGFLTIKGRLKGITRTELEYEIPVNEAKVLMKMCPDYIVVKVRYKIDYKGLLWEVDCFENENRGLILAEIELESEGQSFEKPLWVGEEVTFDMRYYNSWLAIHPYTTWNDVKER